MRLENRIRFGKQIGKIPRDREICIWDVESQTQAFTKPFPLPIDPLLPKHLRNVKNIMKAPLELNCTAKLEPIGCIIKSLKCAFELAHLRKITPPVEAQTCKTRLPVQRALQTFEKSFGSGSIAMHLFSAWV